VTYLTRLILNPRYHRVQHDLADCQRLHSTLLSGFPDLPGVEARARLGVLYRVEAPPSPLHILVQSAVAPAWSSLPRAYVLAEPEIRRIDASYAAIHDGQRLRFRLRANPTKRVLREETRGGKCWAGKRVNLVNEEDQLAWLGRKGEGGGFQLVSVQTSHGVPQVQATPRPRTRGDRDGRTLTFGSVQFDGVLSVTDADRFRHALTGGIGSGKAYGFGLLSVAAT